MTDYEKQKIEEFRKYIASIDHATFTSANEFQEAIEQFLLETIRETEERCEKGKMQIDFVTSGKGVNGEECFLPKITLPNGDIYEPAIGYPDAVLSWYKLKKKSKCISGWV